MRTGIRLSEDFKVVLGETREEVIEGIESMGLKYMISFDKVNNTKSKETIIQIPSMDMEISLKNDIVVYMQSKVSAYNILFNSSNMASIDIIKTLKEAIAREMEFKRKTEFKIEGMNLKTLDTSIIINDKGVDIRVHIQKDSKHNLYLSAVKYEKEV